VVTVVRQVAEPHLLGNSLGVHPLVTLFFSFFGLRLFGVIGLLLAPLAAVAVKELLTAGKDEEEKQTNV
jgi:predicted PurR-regulated permease PerM